MPRSYENRKRSLIDVLHDLVSNHGTEMFLYCLRGAVSASAEAFSRAGMREEVQIWEDFIIAVDKARAELQRSAKAKG